jgi:hypothetical protein
MSESSWTTPPALLDVDLLLLRMQQKENRALAFQFTVDGLPWRATLDKSETGDVVLSVVLELAALPFTAEANQRRLVSTVLIHILNMHWSQQQQDIRLGLSPRRNTLFLVSKTTCTTTPDLYGLMALMGQKTLALQGSIQVLKTCTPWLLVPHKKISSLQRTKS